MDIIDKTRSQTHIERGGMPADLEENEVIYASTVNTMLDLGCSQSLVMVN